MNINTTNNNDICCQQCHTKIKMKMIDSMTLRISKNQYQVKNPEAFKPPLTEFLRLFEKYKYNIKNTEMPFPNLTISPSWDKKEQKPTCPLKIQFSAPKLIFLNNVDELDEKDFNQVAHTLSRRLCEMGIEIPFETLCNSEVIEIHFSKNILLSGGYTAYYVNKKLERLAINKKLTIKHRDYDNEGHAVYFDCGQYQITTYDKVRDVFKTKRHAVDKDRTEYQQKLLKVIKSHRPPLEIFRLEIRLNKQKFNNLLTKFGYPANPTFREVFNNRLAQKMLQYYWELITPSKSEFLLKEVDSDILLIIDNYLKSHNLKLKAMEVNGLTGMFYYSQQHGVRNLEARMKSMFVPRTWYRLNKWLDLLNQIMAKRENYSFVDDVNDALETSQPMKIDHLLNPEELNFDYQVERT